LQGLEQRGFNYRHRLDTLGLETVGQSDQLEAGVQHCALGVERRCAIGGVDRRGERHDLGDRFDGGAEFVKVVGQVVGSRHVEGNAGVGLDVVRWLIGLVYEA